LESAKSASARLVLSHQEDFSLFFQQTHIQVYRYIYGLTGGPSEDVDDLVAEAYERAWKARRKFRGDHRNALHWIFTIARNQVIDAHRRGKSNHKPESLDENRIAGTGIGLEGQLILDERREILWRLLQTLPEDTREILVLRYLLEWPVAKVAKYLKKKETAVSMAIHRALKRLQDRWPEAEVEFRDRRGSND
jgi:RNA polymerase sigma-70 factor, ECF subfamily